MTVFLLQPDQMKRGMILLQNPCFAGVAGKEQNLSRILLHDKVNGGPQTILVIHGKAVIKNERKLLRGTSL